MGKEKEIFALTKLKKITQADKNKFYFILPLGLGDTLILCALKEELEEKFGAFLCFLIKPSQEIILKMYGITDYNFIELEEDWHYKKPYLYELAQQNPIPKLGEIFVAHPDYHPNLQKFCAELHNLKKDVKFLSWFKKFFDLDIKTVLKEPVMYPEISDYLRKNLPGDLSKVALFIPEARSLPSLPKSFWIKLQKKKEKEGFKVFSNIVEEKNIIEGIENIQMGLNDLVALCMQCGEVHALRSGLCDIIHEKGKGLNVYYHSKAFKSVFGLNTMFSTKDIHERVIRQYFIKIRKLLKYIEVNL